MQFSLSFFTSRRTGTDEPKYSQFLECSQFADRNGFLAVWTPERHFHEFGGLYPNPSLMGAVLSHLTSRVRIRGGSVVLPLHSPIRVAEEWSVVDNLSGGRADIAIAVGWHANDFVLAPQNFQDRIQRTYAGIETIKRLWRGEEILAPNGLGEPTGVRLHPAPVQAELPMWMTCTRSLDVFRAAGEGGFNVLTGLIFLNAEQLAECVRTYREGRAAAGHEPAAGKVTLMLHTFLGPDLASVRDSVRGPLRAYMQASVDLWRHEKKALEKLKERNDAVEFAVQRYFEHSGLFGTVDTCAERVGLLEKLGVDEIACMTDFGLETPVLRESLAHLNRLRGIFAGA